MSRSRDTLNEDVAEILKQANWAGAGVSLKETKETDSKELTESTEETDETEEVTEEHVCPLCSSQLTEAISDEQFEEHVGSILEAYLTEEDSEEITETADELEADEVEETENA